MPAHLPLTGTPTSHVPPCNTARTSHFSTRTSQRKAQCDCPCLLRSRPGSCPSLPERQSRHAPTSPKHTSAGQPLSDAGTRPETRNPGHTTSSTQNLTENGTLKRTFHHTVIRCHENGLCQWVFDGHVGSWEDSASNLATCISEHLRTTSHRTPSDINLEVARHTSLSRHRDSAQAILRRPLDCFERRLHDSRLRQLVASLRR